MTLREELQQWIKNYDVLTERLSAAFKFKNKLEIDSLSKRIVLTQRQIAEVAITLEKNSNPDAYNTVGTTVSSCVDISKYPSLNLNCVDGDGSK